MKKIAFLIIALIHLINLCARQTKGPSLTKLSRIVTLEKVSPGAAPLEYYGNEIFDHHDQY
jgi:hypothetical protein